MISHRDKSFHRYIALLLVTVVIGLVVIFVLYASFGKQASKVVKTTTESKQVDLDTSPIKRRSNPPITVNPEDISSWEDRFLYFDIYENAYLSANVEGKEVVLHKMLCGDKVVLPVSNISRSPDGTNLAFIIPIDSADKSNFDWKTNRKFILMESRQEGEIIFFNLANNRCTKTNLKASYNFNQTLAFSPNGKYLAYIHDGLQILDLESNTTMLPPKIADTLNVITGPLVWNLKSNAIYMSVHNEKYFNSPDPQPGFLEKYEIGKGSTTTHIELPPIFESKTGSSLYWGEDEVYPDDPTQYAISPSEKFVALEENGNLVIKSLVSASTPAKIVYDRKKDCYEGEPFGHPLHLTWTKNDMLLFEISCCGCASSKGTTRVSIKGNQSRKISEDYQVHGYSLNVDQTKLVYNHDFFGDYYLSSEERNITPKDFVSSGHRYDGIGVFDLSSNTSQEFSGPNAVYGNNLVWN